MMFEAWELEGDPRRHHRMVAAAVASFGVVTGLLVLGAVLSARATEAPRERIVDVAFRPPAEVKKPPPPPPVVAPKVAKVRPPPIADAPPVVAPPAPAPAAAPIVTPRAIPKERPPEADHPVAAQVVAIGGTGDGTGSGVGEEAESAAPIVAVAGSTGPVNLPEDAEPAEPRDDNVMPEYPEAARASGLESVVILKVVIERDGRVGKIQVMKGDEPFLSAALAAVKSWAYEPARLANEPISIFKIIKLPFRLRND